MTKSGALEAFELDQRGLRLSQRTRQERRTPQSRLHPVPWIAGTLPVGFGGGGGLPSRRQRLDRGVSPAPPNQSDIGQEVEESLDGRLQNAARQGHDEAVDRPEETDQQQGAGRDARERERDRHDRSEQQQGAGDDPHEAKRLITRPAGPIERALEQGGQAQVRKVEGGRAPIKQSPIDFLEGPS